MLWPGTGSLANSLFLRRLRVKEVWERKLLCKHGGFCLCVWSLPCVHVISIQCLGACVSPGGRSRSPGFQAAQKIVRLGLHPGPSLANYVAWVQSFDLTDTPCPHL